PHVKDWQAVKELICRGGPPWPPLLPLNDRMRWSRRATPTRQGIMREAVIVSAVRTAVGKAPKGTLRTTRPAEMGAVVIKEAIDRVPGLEMSAIEDVIMGCAMPEAEQGMNVARAAAIRAGLPVETSGV